MPPFKLAHSTDSNWQTALEDCLLQLNDIPPETNLGFIYVTDHFAADFAQINRYLQDKTGIAHWTGTIGHAVCCTNKEYYEQAAIVMMLAEFPPDSFYLVQSPDQLPTTKNEGLQFAVVHGDPRNRHIPDLLEQFATQLGDAWLVGGLTSSASYYYQLANEITEGQLSGVIFSDQVAVVSGLTQGCSPIGPVHTITECEGNYAISLDHRPALSVLKEDIGEILARDLNQIGRAHV